MSSQYSIEWQMKRYNISKEEAENKIKNLKNKTRDNFKNMSHFDFKAMSPKNKEHWIKKGYTENEAILLAKDQIKHMQKSFTKKRIEDPEKYKNTYITKIEYWLKKGYTEEEAKQKISKNQNTFSLEKCINKYGKKEGEKKWRARQVNWQNTLNNKTPEEKERINKLKGITLENMIRKWGIIDGTEKYDNWLKTRPNYHSKISQELFLELLKNIEDKENVKFALQDGEKAIQKGSICYLYDFCYNKKIIEFNGDKWHANPKIYKEMDTPNPYSNLPAIEIWKLDEIKNNFAKTSGYDILVIWESDYKKNKNKEIIKCLNFLNLYQ